MSDSSDEERRVSSSDSSSDDEILSAPTIGNRIKRERKATERFEAGPATGRAAGAGEAKYSPGGTKQTNLNDLLREKQRKDRRKRDLAAGYDEAGAGEAKYSPGGTKQTNLNDLLMVEHRQLVDGWSDDEDGDDEMPCAFARWEAHAWSELPHYVPPIDRKVAHSDAAARSFRDAHKRGVASELRLLLEAYRPQLAGRTQQATPPTVLRWLLGLTACSFDEGVANQAFELLSLLLAKVDTNSATSGDRWPQLGLIAEYINLYGTSSRLPTPSEPANSELAMQRYRSAGPLVARAADTAAVGEAATRPSPARPTVRKRKRRGEIEVPGVGDEVKVAFKQGTKGEMTFYDGEVVKTATEGRVPQDASVMQHNGTAYART
jgi:hypothetical protein